MDYSAEPIGLMSFAVIFGGVLGGKFVARRLSSHHLSSETQSFFTDHIGEATLEFRLPCR